MAKRFTDSDKWKKPWFRHLRPVHKVFWEYLRDNCDNAGIWEVDFDLASYHIGETLDPQETMEVFAKQIFHFAGGRRWFIVDFIDFQCGDLVPTNNAHRSVINALKKYGLWDIYQAKKSADMDMKQSNPGAAQPLGNPSGGAQEQEKDTDKDLDLGKGDARGKPKEPWPPESPEFRFAKFFSEFLPDWGRGAKPPDAHRLQKWACTFDAIHRIDGREWQDIEDVLNAIDLEKPNGKGDFLWRHQILSPDTLRERWNQGKLHKFVKEKIHER